MKRTGPSFIIPVSASGKIITLQGDMFNFRTSNGLYLSSNKPNPLQKYYDLFSATRSVSANNPPFSAIPVDNFTVHTNNIIVFNLPKFDEPQRLDIVYANPAGYNLASRGKRFTYIEIVSGF